MMDYQYFYENEELSIIIENDQIKPEDLISQVNSWLDFKRIDYIFDEIVQTLSAFEVGVKYPLYTGSIQNIDEDMDITIEDGGLTAYAKFYLPCNERFIDKTFIIAKLNAKSIREGILFDAIETHIQDKTFGQKILIAQGVKPIHGKDAYIQYFFSVKNTINPRMLEDGTVDYHQLDLIAHVKTGDLLATLFMHVDGVDGKDVYGNILKAKVPKRERLRYGRNVEVTEDKMSLRATKNGQVKLVEDKVVVYDFYEVVTNVGSSTGDIEFDGSVNIKGNVMTGFSVKASGDIEIYGTVEGANIVSGGNVVLHRGIQGMGKGVIKAKGNLAAKYIENCKVECYGNIHSEALLHSEVSAKGTIKVEGKKGMISGGNVRSGIEVDSRIIGSHMGTVTIVEVGIDPTLISEMKELEKNVAQMEIDLDKVDKIVTYLTKAKNAGITLDDDKQKMLVLATREKIITGNKFQISVKRLADIKEELSNKNNGKVRCMEKAYPGVVILIGNVQYRVKSEITYTTFYQDGADIRLQPY